MEHGSVGRGSGGKGLGSWRSYQGAGSFRNRKKSPNDHCIKFQMDQKDGVGQNRGESDHRNNIFGVMLPSLIARKRLLVVTIRVLPMSSPTSAVRGKRGRGPGAALGYLLLFFLHIFDF